jgi:acetyl esterase/lipase
MARIALVCSIALLVAASAAGQDMAFYYPAPQPSQIRFTKDVAYGPLRLDVYQPATAADGRSPAVVLFHVAAGQQRDSPFIRAWAEILASQQIVAIQPDLRPESVESDFDAAIAHVRENAATFGIDPERLAVYAGSANVSSALPIVQNPRHSPSSCHRH